MRNSTLVFKSLGIIVLLAGIAHLFTYVAKKDSLKDEENTAISHEVMLVADSLENSITSSSPKKTELTPVKKKRTSYNEETDYIIDKWKVAYNSSDFSGSIIYDIRKEGKVFNAYTYQYEDKNGNIQKAEDAKVLMIKSFDGYKGIGIYKIEYEGEKYDIDCQIDMVDENTFKLSYDYYGYSDVETWKRQ